MTISEKQMRAKVKRYVARNGGPAACAESFSVWYDWPVTPAYLRMVINGDRPPSAKLCRLMGYRIIKPTGKRYQEIDNAT